MSFWSFFKQRDPLEQNVSMIVRSAVRWERKHPGRPIHECLGPRTGALLRSLIPKDSKERLSLDSIIEADPPISDTREFCCAALEIVSGVTPDQELEYARLIALVDRELAHRRSR